MSGSYAFSIHDRVGNIHIPGTGFVLTVGGPNGLDNMVQYDPSKLVHVQLGAPASAWQQFTRCDVPSINITGLSLPITSANFPCMVKLTDAQSRPYTFILASPPYPSMPDPGPISACTAPADWCMFRQHKHNRTRPLPAAFQITLYSGRRHNPASRRSRSPRAAEARARPAGSLAGGRPCPEGIRSKT